jgi:hypothetical protein
MGNQALILVLGTLFLVGIYVGGFMNTSKDITDNSTLAHANVVAKEINNTAVEMAMGKLAEDFKYRTKLDSIPLFGGFATVTFKDTVVQTDSCVIVSSFARYDGGSTTTYSETRAIVKSSGFVPWVVKGAITAFGPLNRTLSDMVIDGRDWNANGTTFAANQGIYAISTGAALFVNTAGARLGGTSQPPFAVMDIPPAYPHNPLVVQTNTPWPNGWPTTPDAAMGFPEGTLKQMAIKKILPGSQYVTSWNQLKFPLRGVTYMEVPNGTVLSKRHIGNNPEGILVFHSPAGDAFWNNISVPNKAPFKGLLLMDKVFHIHMDILGGLVMLNPNTINDRDCQGNKDHWIRFSSETIKSATGGGSGGNDRSWKSRLKVVAWYE